MQNKNILALVVFITTLFCIQTLKSQTVLPTADELFEDKNYLQAVEEFKKEERQFPQDMEIKYQIGICYLNIYADKSRAIPYFEQCYKTGKYRNELLLDMAKAYQFAYRFKEAISFYTKYREKLSAKQFPLIDHYIETCENAQVLIKKPVNITFEHLGKEINTKYADYYPFVTKDEKTLFFTSRREQNTGKLRSFNGYFTSDIYTSKVENGVWTNSKNMGVTINATEDEECVGISPDGKNMIIYVDNVDFPGDLFHTKIEKTKVFTKPVPFNLPVNTDMVEAEGCYGSDANTLFFVSNRKGGIGETDIYFCKKLPNGEWGIPQNLGKNINTIYKEAFPQVTDDGKTLFFSSQGHTSMGGYDIFKSTWNEKEQTWNTPTNVGYPLNTTDDDMMFSVCGNGRDGYISAWRKEGFGDLDIYKIIFNNVEERQTALIGNVTLPDTSKKTINAFISIKNMKDNKVLDSKNVNKLTGKYIFIVTPGKYQIEITCSGYKPIQESVIVYDKADFKTEQVKNFTLMEDANYVPVKEIKAKPKSKPKAKNSL